MGDCMYIILKGEVAVYVPDPSWHPSNEDYRKMLQLGTLKAGQTFGGNYCII